MNLLQQIHRGRTNMPPRLMVYGIEGIGKSTLAAETPQPIFVQTEDGLGEIDCDKFPLAESFDDVMAALSALEQESHEYETVVVDSLDWLERLIWDALCVQHRVASIEKVDGGYGKGYIHALGLWRRVIRQLDTLHKQRHMMVLLIAHAKIERFEDPESSAYDRYSPRLHKHASALITEWCDGVLFATRKFTTRQEDGGFGRQRTIAAPIGADGGERILRAVGGPTCVAKNRYRLPPELPLSWPSIVTGITGAPTETHSLDNSSLQPSNNGEHHNG